MARTRFCTLCVVADMHRTTTCSIYTRQMRGGTRETYSTILFSAQASSSRNSSDFYKVSRRNRPHVTENVPHKNRRRQHRPQPQQTDDCTVQQHRWAVEGTTCKTAYLSDERWCRMENYSRHPLGHAEQEVALQIWNLEPDARRISEGSR